MPKPAKGARLGSGPDHERLLLAGMAASLFREERIRTTATRARRLRPVAERLITLGKRGDVAARRQALSVIEDRDIVHKLFAEIAPRYAERPGGYTRILKLGPRKGDAAPMALIELVEEAELAGSAPSAAQSEQRRRLLRRRTARTEPGKPVQPEPGAARRRGARPEPEGAAPAAADEAETPEKAPGDGGTE